jgi:glycerate-2-kinase
MIKIFQKNNKQKILAICIIMILSVSVSATFAKASPIDELSTSSATHPTTDLKSLNTSENISSYLEQLGYSEQNISSLSGNSITKLLLSQGNQP